MNARDEGMRRIPRHQLLSHRRKSAVNTFFLDQHTKTAQNHFFHLQIAHPTHDFADRPKANKQKKKANMSKQNERQNADRAMNLAPNNSPESVFSSSPTFQKRK
jgi:hypothetical protein